MDETLSGTAPGYVCPECRHALQPRADGLVCVPCDRTYPLVGGIPDFISPGPQADGASLLRLAKKADLLAPIYESRAWYQFALWTAGARRSSVESIAEFHARSLDGVGGSILDVACGPATYARRLASPTRAMCGIDISMGMLQKGAAYIARDHVPGVQLARARVERLPFEAAVFNGAICSGSLHLFPDTVASLAEIGRVMRAGAPLTVQTFIKGNTRVGVLMHLFRVSRAVQRFGPPELQRCLAEAGFEGFRSETDGIVILFGARRASPSV